MKNQKSRYLIEIDVPKELNNFSYIFTGLYELKKENKIDFKFKFRFPKNQKRIVVSDLGNVKIDNHHCPKLTYYRLLDRQTNKKINFSIDLADSSNFYSLASFKNSDYIFKRSFLSKHNNHLDKSQQKKLHMLGVTIAMLPDKVHFKYKFIIVLGALINSFKDYLKLDRLLIKRLSTFKRKLIRFSSFKKIRTLSLFDKKPVENFSKHIFYQKRCFPYEPDKDIKSIHKQRYDIVKLLKNNFNDIFVGGLSDSKMVRNKFADALTNLSSDPKEFLLKIRECGIMVYTRGIAHSIGFTLPEYFSQGKIVVAEGISNEVPVSFKDGEELLFFDNEEELVLKIKDLLSDDKLCCHLSKKGREYYENYIHPKQNVTRILKIMGCEI